jgi:hypothetical protein
MRIKSVPPKIEDEYDLTEIYPFFTWKECEVCHDKIKTRTNVGFACAFDK